jgi:outer membrane protein
MNLKFALTTALVAGLLPVALVAQAPTAAQPAAPAAPPAVAAVAPAAPAPVEPTAYPAKIALVSFEQAVFATNEGQRSVDELRKKYQPKKDQMDALAAEVDSLKKKLQAAPATMSDTDRQALVKSIDAKDKQYQRDAEEAQNSYNSDVQEALGKVAQKVNAVMVNYVEKNGYTLLLNVGGQQSQVMWTAATPNADITEAIVAAYNTSSGVAAPTPTAPAPSTAPAHKPAGATTHTTTPAPKPQSK